MNTNDILRKKILFADLDGTLIETFTGKLFPKGIWDMKIKFDVLDAIITLNPDFVFIVSNQGGIEKGLVNETNFDAKIEYLTRAIKEYCGVPCYCMYAMSNDINSPYRTPNTKMLEILIKKYVGGNVDYIKNKSMMIGDASGKTGQFSDCDKKTAENFGIDYMDVNDFVEHLNFAKQNNGIIDFVG